MNIDDVAYTMAWWEKLVKDEGRLITWLQKLHETEYAGYQDNVDAAEKWTTKNSTPYNVLMKTGSDEAYHADLLRDVLRGRGVWPIEQAPRPSEYWDFMGSKIDSLETCAAVFHFGEQLAADRFEIMLDLPCTPSDVRWFLRKALPDEDMHARAFRRLSNESCLYEMTRWHEKAIELLKGKK